MNAALGAAESDHNFLERQRDAVPPALELRIEEMGKKKRFYIKLFDPARHRLVAETIRDNRAECVRLSADERQRRKAGVA